MDTLWLLYLPLIFALYIFTKHFFHKLQNLPPSPLLNIPFLGHLYLLNKPIYRSLAKISDRYGPVLLLQFGSRRVLVVSSPSAAEDCLSKNDVVFANRPRLLAGKHVGDNYTSLVWSSYGDHWRNLRKISSIEISSPHRMQMFHRVRADEVKSMIRALYQASDERKLVEMKAVFFELSVNVMMRMIAGKRYYGEGVEDVEEGRRFRKVAMDMFRLESSSMGDFVPVVRWLGVGGAEKGLAELQRRNTVFVQELVDECKAKVRDGGGEAEGKTKTMIEMLLELQEKEPEFYTDAYIRSLVLVMFVASIDAAGGTMEWALSLILNNPHVLKKAQSEIDSHIGPDCRLLNESDVSELPYLRCIIKETLRLYPAGPLLVPHESSDQCIVGGYRVPAGTMLLVNAWAIHNDSKNWEDAREFKPERFEGLDGNQERFRVMPFGLGRRSCPGEGLAMRMMGFGLGSLIQCFYWDREGEELVDMTEGEGLTLPKATPLMAYCRPRPVVGKLLSGV